MGRGPCSGLNSPCMRHRRETLPWDAGGLAGGVDFVKILALYPKLMSFFGKKVKVPDGVAVLG